MRYSCKKTATVLDCFKRWSKDDAALLDEGASLHEVASQVEAALKDETVEMFKAVSLFRQLHKMRLSYMKRLSPKIWLPHNKWGPHKLTHKIGCLTREGLLATWGCFLVSGCLSWNYIFFKAYWDAFVLRADWETIRNRILCLWNPMALFLCLLYYPNTVKTKCRDVTELTDIGKQAGLSCAKLIRSWG
jgi:hypothetical protein